MASHSTRYGALVVVALLLIGGAFFGGILMMGHEAPPAAAKPAPVVAASEAAPAVPTPAPPPAPAEPAGPRLVVKKAVYGDPAGDFVANSKDVTALVIKMVKDDSLVFTPTNENMGGDPAYGTKKYLRVTYTFDGIEKETRAGENEGMMLTPNNQ